MSTARVTVRPGDTVGALALRHGVSQASILKANGLSAGSLIVAGRTLRIPVPTGFSGNSFAGRTYSSAVVGAAGTNRGYLAGSALPSRSSTRAMIIERPAGTASTPGSPWPSPGRSPAGASGRSPWRTPSASCR